MRLATCMQILILVYLGMPDTTFGWGHLFMLARFVSPTFQPPNETTKVGYSII